MQPARKPAAGPLDAGVPKPRKFLHGHIRPALAYNAAGFHLALEENRAVVVAANAVLRACVGPAAEKQIELVRIKIDSSRLITVAADPGRVRIGCQFHPGPLLHRSGGILANEKLEFRCQSRVTLHSEIPMAW